MPPWRSSSWPPPPRPRPEPSPSTDLLHSSLSLCLSAIICQSPHFFKSRTEHRQYPTPRVSISPCLCATPPASTDTESPLFATTSVQLRLSQEVPSATIPKPFLGLLAGESHPGAHSQAGSALWPSPASWPRRHRRISYGRVAGQRGFAPRRLALVSASVLVRRSPALLLKVNRRRPSPSLV